ncbi:MAG: flippase-like domain-containing protein [Elusimicrobia bacterium]|nr:flippase-like domain-containing protein [Elusimicrobiota bacterium]
MISWKRFGSVLVGLFLSAVFLLLAFRNVDLKGVAEVFSKASFGSTAFLTILMVFEIFVRAIRWWILLGKKVSVGTLFQLEMIGLGLNNVLPLRLGEIGRAYLLAKMTGTSTFYTLSTVGVERVLDSITVLFLFGVCSRGMAGSFVPLVYQRLSVVLLGALGVLLLGLIYRGEWLGKVLQKSGSSRVFSLGQKFQHLLSGASVLRSPVVLAGVLLLSLGVWLLDGTVYFWAGKAVGLENILSYSRTLVMLAFVAAAGILPAVPGYFGTYEFMIREVLSRWGVPPAVGVGYAGFVHITAYVVVTGLGMIFLYRAGYSLSGIWGAAQESKTEK